MNEWVQVDPSTVNKEIQKDIRGVSVKVSASPYDIPVRIRGNKEPNSNFFVIELQFPTTGEATREVRPKPGEPIVLEIGVRSQRIYKIKIDVVHFNVQAVSLEVVREQMEREIEGAINEFSSSPDRLKDRYAATGEAIRSNRDVLLGTLK